MTISNQTLSILVFLPLIGACLQVPLWKCELWAKRVALGFAAIELMLVGWLLVYTPTVATSLPGYVLLQDLPWIERFGIRYTLGMDGISLLLVALTALITIIAMLVSWQGVKERVALHYLFLLVIESGIMGVFLSLDLFLFYLFWELMLIPMFFLIGIWGHGRRIYAAVKFFLFTMAGSLLMLLAIIVLYLIHGSQSGRYSFALHELVGTAMSPTISIWLYAAFLIAFAIKVPIFPLHTWLPDAHTDAPTAGSVILAGLLLKTGAYGLIRFGYPLFPEAAKSCTTLLLTLAVVGIVYGSWVAYAQTDMKRLVAYSSVGHMGFVALGIAAWTPIALSGAIIQLVNHGITTSALFAMVGMLDERTDTREIAAYGGVWGKAPLLACCFLLFSMASAGLPGLNNFVGEFLVLAGTFRPAPLAAVIAFIGILLPLIYTVRLVQAILFGSERQPLAVTDLTLREGVVLAVLALGVICLGTHPAPLLDLLKEPVTILTSSSGGGP